MSTAGDSSDSVIMTCLGLSTLKLRCFSTVLWEQVAVKCPQASHRGPEGAGQRVPPGVNLCPLLPGSVEVCYIKARQKEKRISQPFEEGINHINC